MFQLIEIVIVAFESNSTNQQDGNSSNLSFVKSRMGITSSNNDNDSFGLIFGDSMETYRVVDAQ